MEPSRRSSMGSNGNTTATGSANASAAVIELLLPPSMQSVATVANNAKAASLSHGDGHRVPSQHCSNSGNAIQHHQYTPILVGGPPPLIRSSLIHPTGSLLPSSPQLMLSTTTAPASEVIPRYQQQHSGGSHQQLVTVTTSPVSASPVAMPNSNISSASMALSPFGILPHERVVPQQPHHRHQHRKLPNNQQSSKTLIETGGIASNAQILATSATNPQRFYAEPSPHPTNKMKQYDNIQQQQHHRIKTVNGVPDKNLPAVSTGYTPQSYEQRYQSRTAPQQVGYLSVITRTAVTTANGAIIDDISANNNYYQTQALPLQSKTPDNHERQYYHFDPAAAASQTPQQQVDNMLLMGSPVQRGDPMHIVKNLQSMQTDVDCYGVKKMIDQQPRLLVTENSKTVAPTALLTNNSKCLVENQLQHLQQTPKSTVIDSASSYNSQYFNRRQPPPAHLHQHHNQSHLQQHLVAGNTKMLATPTSLAVVSANGNTYLDVQQPHRHHRWALDQQKQPIVSTPSCFSGNMSAGVFHQPSLQQQQYNNTIPTFNVQPTASSIHQQLQMSQSTHLNSFAVSSGNPTYYGPTTTVVSSNITSVTTTSSPMALYNRQLHNDQQNSNNFHDFATNLQGGNFPINNDNRSLSLPHVIVPDIEQELGHLCDDLTALNNVIVKPSTVTVKKPSFIDSYIKFLHGGDNGSNVESDDVCHEKPKKLLRTLTPTTQKPMPKPYIPMTKPKITVSVSEPTASRFGSGEETKKTTNTNVTTKDDDPRYFPLPKTSSSIADDRSDESNAENSWLSADDDHDHWWTNSSKPPSFSAPSTIKHKPDVVNKKKKSNNVGKKPTNSVPAIKKQKTQHEQPRRQLSHRLAKDKTQQLLSNIKGDMDDDDLSDADSDVDPAWIPSNDDNDTSKNPNLLLNRRHFSHKKFSKDHSSLDPPSTSSSINNNNNDQTEDSTTAMPFKSGSFVAHKNQFTEKKSPQQIWRIDGKSLLQKFQQCDDSNLFKSTSTYTGWGPPHYNLYRQLSIEFIKPSGGACAIPNKPTFEIVVKLLNDDISIAKSNSGVKPDVSSPGQSHPLRSRIFNFRSKSTPSVDDQSMWKLRGNFDVYIQTLASQTLDSNFLGEIYRENDDFFLSNIIAIETVTQTCVQAIDSAIAQNSTKHKAYIETVRTLVTKYPDMEVCSMDNVAVNNVQPCCIVCGCQRTLEKQQKFVEIILSGFEYYPHTLKSVNDDDPSKVIPLKKVYCCSDAHCADKFIILHSLKHLKYYIYKECGKRVTAESDGSSNDLARDRTTILNQLLADNEWITKLFHTVCNTWSRANELVFNKQLNCRVPL